MARMATMASAISTMVTPLSLVLCGRRSHDLRIAGGFIKIPQFSLKATAVVFRLLMPA